MEWHCQTYKQMCTYICITMCIYVYIYVYIYMYMCVYIFICVRVYIYTYTYGIRIPYMCLWDVFADVCECLLVSSSPSLFLSSSLSHILPLTCLFKCLPVCVYVLVCLLCWCISPCLFTCTCWCILPCLFTYCECGRVLVKRRARCATQPEECLSESEPPQPTVTV